MTKHSLPKDKIKILLLEGIHPVAAEAFAKAGYHNVVHHKTALEPKQLSQEIVDTHIVGIRSRTHLTQEILQQADKLMAVGCFCIGTNQVDLKTTQAFGIPVFNAPFANTRSVAELVLAEAVLLLRGIPQRSQEMHAGKWQKSAANSFETRGKTLGIIGYGHIGSQVSVLAESLGMKVCFYDIEHKLPLGNAESLSSLEAVLQTSDIVTLHVPATRLTNNMMNAKTIAKMKPGSILINASRGNVVDIPAFADALQSGHLLGGAVDVFPVEPASNQDPFISELQNLPNVILTPHIGGSTQEAQGNIGLEVAEKLIKYSDNGSTSSAVGFPEVSLPTHEGTSRILHIHQNKPGVMNAINTVFSQHQVNVTGQYLQTLGSTGYVVVDFEGEDADALLAELKGIPETIRSRILF